MPESFKYISDPVWKVDTLFGKKNPINEMDTGICPLLPNTIVFPFESGLYFIYEGWNFNSGNYLFTTGTK